MKIANKTSSQYDKYLEEKHSKFNTPESIIFQTAEEATADKPISKEKIVKGEINEVYKVTTENKKVIVRISHSKRNSFEKEEWAIKNVTAQGVPAPKVLLIKTLEDNTNFTSLCVQEMIDGEPLNCIKFKSKKSQIDFMKKLSIKSGEILSKIHNVKAVNFGPLGDNGIGTYKTFKDYILDDAKNIDYFKELSKKIDVNQKTVIRMIEILTNNINYFDDCESILNHGDFGPKHIMVKNDEITGIIDFGGIKGGHPILDFAWWEFFRGDWLPTSLIMEGYTNKKLFDSNFDYLLHLTCLHYGLIFLYYYSKENNIDGLEHTKKRIVKDLEFFK